MDGISTMLHVEVHCSCSLVGSAISADGQGIIVSIDGVGSRFILVLHCSCNIISVLRQQTDIQPIPVVGVAAIE